MTNTSGHMCAYIVILTPILVILGLYTLSVTWPGLRESWWLQRSQRQFTVLAEDPDISASGPAVPSPCESVIPCRDCLSRAQGVFYNRVHKCGSTTSQVVTIWLSHDHHYHWLKKWKDPCRHGFWCETKAEAGELSKNIMDLPKPFFLIRHFHYLDFNKYANNENRTKPVLINIIRDPLSLLNSYYFFNRYSHSERRPWITPQIKATSYTTCVLSDDPLCVSPENYFWIIPFFCGQQPWCREPTRRALNQAVQNVVREYAVVGVLEQFSDFYWALGELMPRYFGGIMQLYNKSGKSTTRNSAKYAEPISAEVAEKMMPKLELEYEFYHFIKARFNRLLDCLRGTL